ncbi:hypothetical protein BH23GEM3_BH23GEM3_20650 [soil metagenome]
MSTVLVNPGRNRFLPPSAERLLHVVRRRWRYGVVSRGVLLSMAVLASSALALVVLDFVRPLSAGARAVLRFLPLFLAGLVAAAAGIRAARGVTLQRLARLVEERAPELDHRLLTALQPTADGPVGRAFVADAEARISALRPRRVLPLRAGAHTLVLAGVLLAWGALALFAPAVVQESWTRWAHPADAYTSSWQEVRAAAMPALPVTSAVPAAGLDELRWTIQPPAYTGLPVREVRDEESITALAGSRVQVRGRVLPSWSGVRVERISQGAHALPVRRDGREWIAQWVLGTDDRGLTIEALAEGGVVDRRAVPVSVQLDEPPNVVLQAPEADMVLAGPSGRIRVQAAGRDDFGIAALELSWIRTRGSGESFTFEEGTWEWNRLQTRGTEVTGEFMLDMAAIDSRPGDVLHIRARARDRNTATGPGEGVSETRVIRIALSDELHTVTTLVGAPVELERHPLLSQRMLIILTERLRDEAPRIGGAETRHESTEIAHQQGRLRSRVGEQIFTRSAGGVQDPLAPITFEDGAHAEAGVHEHGETRGGTHRGAHPPDPEETLEAASAATGTGRPEELAHRHDEAPILNVNRTLIAAYNAMWEAERALLQGEPSGALPHQHEALRLLQEAQAGERVFARGRVRTAPVDVAGVCGSGEIDDASPAGATPSARAPSVRPRLAEIDSLRAALRPGATDEVALGLSALATRVLSDPTADPRAAALLTRASRSAARGRTEEAAELLAGARAMLPPGTLPGSALPLPQPVDPAAAEYFRRIGRRP